MVGWWGGAAEGGASLALLTHLQPSGLESFLFALQGEDPGLFAFAKSNMEYAVLSVETLQNTIANNSKTLKRLKVLLASDAGGRAAGATTT